MDTIERRLSDQHQITISEPTPCFSRNNAQPGAGRFCLIRDRVFSSCSYHIKAHIDTSDISLTDEIAKTVARCIVMSRLDYCNSLLYGVPSQNLNKLQRIQNNLARVVLKKPFRSSAAPLLEELHCASRGAACSLQDSHSGYFRCREGSAPSYLSQLLSDRKHVRELRSIKYIPSRRAQNQHSCCLSRVQFGRT